MTTPELPDIDELFSIDPLTLSKTPGAIEKIITHFRESRHIYLAKKSAANTKSRSKNLTLDDLF